MTNLDVLNRAVAFHKEGKFDKAERIYRDILNKEPDNPDANHLLGLIEFQYGNFSSAEYFINTAIRFNKNISEYHANLGRIMHAKCHYGDAINTFRYALTLSPNNYNIHSDLASSLLAQGDDLAAENSARDSLGLFPNNANALLILGLSIKDKNNDEAEICFYKALKLNSKLTGAYLGLAMIFQRKGHIKEAKTAYQDALRLDPQVIEANCNLGNIYREEGQLSLAVKYLSVAVNTSPENAEVLGNLGVTLLEVGELDKALNYFQRSIQVNNKIPDIRRNYAMALLKAGQLKKGFKEYKWRWLTPQFSSIRRRWNVKEWDGGNVNKQKILIHAEQGFGDTIQFSRYVPLLIKLGAKVSIECPSPLIRLFETFQGVTKVSSNRESLEPYELHVPMLNLPVHFGTTFETIPNTVPYLSVPNTKKVALFSDIEAAKTLNVGIIWKGNPAHKNDSLRSPGLKVLQPLFATKDTHFFALEKDRAEEELKSAHLEDKVVNLGSQFNDFLDTAIAMKKLDLIITPDTAAAHLAGALGLEVWTMLPFVAEWRWLEISQSSPWYPSMRLFRQSSKGDWTKVVSQIILELNSKVENKAKQPVYSL